MPISSVVAARAQSAKTRFPRRANSRQFREKNLPLNFAGAGIYCAALHCNESHGAQTLRGAAILIPPADPLNLNQVMLAEG